MISCSQLETAWREAREAAPEPSVADRRWLLLDSGYACAGIAVDTRDVIVQAAPIFRELVGQRLADVLRRYKLVE